MSITVHIQFYLFSLSFKKAVMYFLPSIDESAQGIHFIHVDQGNSLILNSGFSSAFLVIY